MNLPGAALVRSTFDPTPTDSTSQRRILAGARVAQQLCQECPGRIRSPESALRRRSYRSVTERSAGADPTEGR
jgi:hypothetical protein